MSKKITTGVEKAYYAILKEDGVTPKYGTVHYLPGLREISVAAKEEQATIYAENRLYDSENSLGEIEVTLDFASIDTADYAALFGKKIAKNGGIIESSSDQPPYIVLMVEKTLSGGVKEYLTLFKGKLAIPEDKAKTKEGKTEYQTMSLNGIFMPLDNGMWKHSVKTTDEGFDATTHAENWGKTVLLPSTEEVEKLTITGDPEDNASNVAKNKTITLTFNNAITQFTVSLLKNDFTVVDSNISINETKKVITIDPKADLTGSTKYAVMVNGVKDIYGQVLADTIIDFTTIE
ncbi:MAG: Ig-like domain-containing protein [Clostridium sp.]|uniref:major tail protein n=1 Tax=Clostridium TaxID=1485 RepID=UPI0018ABA76B|nr:MULTISPECIES: major tail protein [Clostridium]MDU1095133.1 Ig-like domain-containing protein [Clostridioides difficile]MDB2100601.1 Ig-like domain-containing protein [Clostridium paraputrificum]MDU1126492.1 Ig-like domain-containing protein [Clostridium sp.]MDU3675107.1 Ig-like domain-containing protein [Clostridium sp.]MDU6873539.1 Ig-like domain-containing protein [Clostridium sp.]